MLRETHFARRKNDSAPDTPPSDETLPIVNDLRSQLAEAVTAWLTRSPSAETREAATGVS